MKCSISLLTQRLGRATGGQRGFAARISPTSLGFTGKEIFTAGKEHNTEVAENQSKSGKLLLYR
jgi:hypothetical protein